MSESDQFRQYAEDFGPPNRSRRYSPSTKLAAFWNSPRALPCALQSRAGRERFRASAANASSPLSLSKPQATPVRLQVTEPISAWRAANAAHAVWATTPTPCGSLMTAVTPATAFAFPSSILSGTDPSTGARNTQLKKTADLRLIGKDRVELPSKVNGSATYGIDVQVPGMLYGTAPV